MTYFRVAALDLDGTLTSQGKLSMAAVEAIDAVREDGLAVLLVTGRIQSELEGEFPGFADHFDAKVLENGAVSVVGGSVRLLAPPIEPVLTDALASAGVPFRRGAVLLAVDGKHSPTVVQAITDLELDYQVIRNRESAMVLPASVTKGNGLIATLSDMNLSRHNTIAVGDAENDLSLLEVAEVGVAVANAVQSVRLRADVVLDTENGKGVAALLTGPLVSGVQRLCPPRHWVDVGSFDDGSPAQVPGAQAKILVTGPSGAGKSYVIGLMAERWIMAGYSVLVLDPEGDHVGLGELSNVRIVDAAEHLPQPVDLLRSMIHPLISVVLDMSGLGMADQVAYLRRLRAVINAQRAQRGVPHWVVLDEAHLDEDDAAENTQSWTPRTGYCLASFMPELIPASSVESTDVVLQLQNGEDDAGLTSRTLPERSTIQVGRGPARSFLIGDRRTAHVRHRHKYADQTLPPPRRFYFHVTHGEPIVAATLNEFRATVHHCDPAVLEYHLVRGDLSRWLKGTIADQQLGALVAALESDLAGRRAADIERVRRELVRAITERYVEDSRAPKRPHGPRH